jgi:predicted RNA-binding Zn ribbon-like protein
MVYNGYIMTTTTDIALAATGAPEEQLVDFLNTIDVETGSDVLASESAYVAWAMSKQLEPGDFDEARRVRDALRDLVSGIACVLPEVSLRTVATEDGVVLAGDTAPQAAVAIATVLSIQGKLGRVKLCPCEDCRWAFFDQSRNSSKTWCSMAVCGNRVKARTYRSKASEAD